MQPPALPLPHALPFFLDADGGELFCMYHAPAPGQPLLGAILYVPPFADELNKCRRMAALQARAFAAHGYAVLQIDLWGCGDSSGDFADANWQRWLSDLAEGWHWLARHAPAPAYLWGVRLGALLALQFARQAQPSVAGALLWQPELDGAEYLRTLQRLQHLGSLFNPAARAAKLADLHAEEIGGYALHPQLREALRQSHPPAAPPFPVCWLEFIVSPQATATDTATARHAGKRRLLDNWQRAGCKLAQHQLAGAPFWAANEVLLIPEAFALGVAGLQAMQS